MTRALQQRVDAIAAFAADVAHELKNPLASLSLAVEQLEKEGAEQNQIVTMLYQDIQRMNRLINSALESSRLDAALSRLKREPIDILAILRSISISHDSHFCILPPLSEKENLYVEGHESWLHQLFENCLDNAHAFSPTGKKPTIVLEATSEKVIIHIDDEGEGIKIEKTEKLFERFYSDRSAAHDVEHHFWFGFKHRLSNCSGASGEAHSTESVS